MTDHLIADALALADAGGPAPGWHHLAACHGQPITLFFPPRGGRDNHTRAAAHICGPCPARTACLADGITAERHGLEAGYRAGLGRNRIRRIATRGRAPGPHRDQSTRRRVADLTRGGHTAQQIAQLLGLSERTVQRWRAASPAPGKAA